MVTRDQVFKTLQGVQDPELGGNVVELGMVTDVRISDNDVEIGLALTVADHPGRGGRIAKLLEDLEDRAA